MNNRDRLQQKLKLHFRRFEFKYLIARSQQDRIRKQLSRFMRPDIFVGKSGDYLVTSLYFDSPGLRYYRENEAGLLQRQKIRQRYYNEDRGKVFYEIKRKNGDVVIKDRYLAGTGSVDLRREMDFYFVRHRLRPVVWVRYQREPWVVNGGEQLRVTFDRQLEMSGYREGEKIMGFPRTILNDAVVMEVKYFGKLPSWLFRVINKYSLERRAMGKYRLAIEKLRVV